MREMTATLLLLASLLCAGETSAALLFVSTTDDDLSANGNCTLREAIQAANTNSAVDACPKGDSSSLDTIVILATGTLISSLGEMVVTERVSIGGPGAESLAIAGTDRIFAVDMAVASHDFGLIGLTLQGADAGAGNGGAVYLENVDQATFELVDFVGNQATEGGAIGVSNLLGDQQNGISIHRCLFSGNAAVDLGGAVAIGEKSNGAVRFLSLEISESAFVGNTAGVGGGAVLAELTDSSVVSLESSSFVRNSAGEFGGAVYLQNPGSSDGVPSTIENCTFVGNRSPESGGAVRTTFAELRIVNTTFHLNSSEASGAHLSTLAVSGQIREVGHTVFGETSEGLGCLGPPSSLGFNLSADASCYAAGPGDLQNVPSGLGGVLGIVDAATVVLPAVGSVLIDGGNPLGCLGVDGGPLTVDQRGAPRPVDGDGDMQAVCDRGAAEVEEGYSGVFADGFEIATVAAWSGTAP